MGSLVVTAGAGVDAAGDDASVSPTWAGQAAERCSLYVIRSPGVLDRSSAEHRVARADAMRPPR